MATILKIRIDYNIFFEASAAELKNDERSKSHREGGSHF